MRPFFIRWTPRGGYNPSARITGEQQNSIYAGLNMILVGEGESMHLEQYTGYNLFAASGSNTLATGTAAITTDSTTVTGTGTLFTRELVPGQEIAISSRVFSVFRIDSDTSMVVTPKAHTTGSGIPIALLQQIQELDTKIATLIRGSIIRLPKNHLLGVGRGVVRLNGAVLPGAGWTLTDQPQVAVYDVLTGNYTPYRLGMNTPALTTVTPVVGGGVKGMPAGNYTVRIVPYKFATEGYNLPSEAIAVTLATAGDRISVTFPAMDTANGQDGWLVYGTKSTSSAANPMMGPWYTGPSLRLSSTQVSSAGVAFTLEWSDAEITTPLEFDNDPPPPAAFMASLGGLPVLVGCRGMGRQLTGTAATTAGNATITGTSTLFTTELSLGRFVWIGSNLYKVLTIASATSMTVDPTPTATASPLTIRSAEEAPGPVLHPAKFGLNGLNFDAYSFKAAVAIDPPDNILGYYQAKTRIYCLTANSLAYAERNDDPATSSTLPLVTRPFWKVGFRNPRAFVAVNGYIYAFTTAGATRSAEFGDTVQTEHQFAAKVFSDMAGWDPGKVTVAYNQDFESVCFMHADDGTRSGGTARYGTMLMFMLHSGEWSPPLRMEDLSDVDPTYATSTATVQGKMYFASPTNLGVTNIYELSVPGGEVGETFIAPNFMDADAEGYDKNIRAVGVTAGRSNSANATLDVYGSVVDGAVPVTDLRAGTNSQSGNISVALNTPVVVTSAKKMAINNLQLFTVRIKLANSGSVGARVDELRISGNICEILR